MVNPSPFIFAPSQYWDGNDGKWSSFSIRVGTPEQNFRVLPATNTGDTIIPIVDGCENEDDPPDCGNRRGVYSFEGDPSQGFVTNESSTWNEIGIFQANLRPVLNITGNALYGLDKVGLMVEDRSGPTLDGMVVGAIKNPRVYVGLFGLKPSALNFSGYEHPQSSMLQRLKHSHTVSSLSYGYTAGAYYSKYLIQYFP